MGILGVITESACDCIGKRRKKQEGKAKDKRVHDLRFLGCVGCKLDHIFSGLLIASSLFGRTARLVSRRRSGNCRYYLRPC